MRKLTELDLQTAMDECAEIKFRTHGEWLAGMVKRLNNAITIVTSSKSANPFIKPAVVIPPIKTILQSGNVTASEESCIS